VFPTAGAGLHVSASPFDLHALQRATHACDLVADGCTHVHLDAAHMGVGGACGVCVCVCVACACVCRWWLCVV